MGERPAGRVERDLGWQRAGRKRAHPRLAGGGRGDGRLAHQRNDRRGAPRRRRGAGVPHRGDAQSRRDFRHRPGARRRGRQSDHRPAVRGAARCPCRGHAANVGLRRAGGLGRGRGLCRRGAATVPRWPHFRLGRPDRGRGAGGQRRGAPHARGRSARDRAPRAGPGAGPDRPAPGRRAVPVARRCRGRRAACHGLFRRYRRGADRDRRRAGRGRWHAAAELSAGAGRPLATLGRGRGRLDRGAGRAGRRQPDDFRWNGGPGRRPHRRCGRL